MEKDSVVMLCLMKTWLVETLRCLVIFEAYFQCEDMFYLFIISYIFTLLTTTKSYLKNPAEGVY